jgi:hypothetical protein
MSIKKKGDCITPTSPRVDNAAANEWVAHVLHYVSKNNCGKLCKALLGLDSIIMLYANASL